MESLQMSMKERRKLEIFSSVKRQKQGLARAALQLNLSVRQTQRIWKRYREQGDTGLVHRSRGAGHVLSDGDFYDQKGDLSNEF